MPTTLTLHPTGQVLTVPTSWADVTLAQFAAIYAPVPDEERTMVELLLGLEAGDLDQLAADDVVYLTNLLDFANDPDSVLELLPTPGLPDVGSLPYGTLILAQQRIKQELERPWLAYGAHLLALYRMTLLHGSAIPTKVAACEAALLAAPVTEVYADAAHFFGALKNWPSATPQTRPTTPKKAKKSWRADTDPPLAERFGPLLALDMLAGGSILHYEAVLKMDADTALSKLKMENARSAFQRRYQEIIHQKKD